METLRRRTVALASAERPEKPLAASRRAMFQNRSVTRLAWAACRARRHPAFPERRGTEGRRHGKCNRLHQYRFRRK